MSERVTSGGESDPHNGLGGARCTQSIRVRLQDDQASSYNNLMHIAFNRSIQPTCGAHLRRVHQRGDRWAN